MKNASFQVGCFVCWYARIESQAGGSFPLSDLFQGRGPSLDCFGGVAVRAQPKGILAANLHQRSQAVEATGNCFVIHWSLTFGLWPLALGLWSLDLWIFDSQLA